MRHKAPFLGAETIMVQEDERAEVVQDHALPLPSYLSYLLY